MSDWSSFEKDKRLTDSWRKYLTEVATVGGSDIQGLIGYGVKPKPEEPAAPAAPTAPEWYGVVMTDDSTLIGISGAPMTAVTSGAEPEAPPAATGTTPPKTPPPPAVTTEIAGPPLSDEERKEPAADVAKPEEPKEEFHPERILYGPEGYQKEWNKLGRETKKVNPFSFAEVPYQERGGKITSSENKKLMELFKTEFREFFTSREQLAIPESEYFPRKLNEREGEPSRFDHEKNLAAIKKAEKAAGEEFEGESYEALFTPEGFFEAVESYEGAQKDAEGVFKIGWYFEDLRTPPEEEKLPPEEVIPGRFVVVNLPKKAYKSMTGQWKKGGHPEKGFIPALNKFAAFVGPFIEPTKSKFAGDERYQDKKKLAARRAELQKQIFEGLRRMLLIYEAQHPMARVIDTDYLRGSAAEMARKYDKIRTESPGTARDIYNIADSFIGGTETTSSAEKGSYRRRALLDVIDSIRWVAEDPNPIEKYAAENPSKSKDTGPVPTGPGKIAAPGKPGAQGPTGGLAHGGEGQTGKGAYSRQIAKSLVRKRSRPEKTTGPARGSLKALGVRPKAMSLKKGGLRGLEEQQLFDRWKLLAGIKKEVI